MTMSWFRKASGKALERLKHIYGYLRRFKSAATRVHVDEPDFIAFPIQEFDWAETVYVKVQEEIPKDIQEPHGKPVVSVHYVDANLYHDNITGRLVTGILHFCNQTLIELFSNCQACAQTAIFRSELVAAGIAAEYSELPCRPSQGTELPVWRQPSCGNQQCHTAIDIKYAAQCTIFSPCWRSHRCRYGNLLLD
jgi:hypothetical protein